MVQLLQGSCCRNPEPFAFAVVSISFSGMGQLALCFSHSFDLLLGSATFLSVVQEVSSAMLPLLL